jgi:sulfur carrier protein ThiS
VKIHFESLGLPTLAGLIGKKTVVELDGTTVVDLINQIVNEHGQEVCSILLDQSNQLDHTIQVMVNNEGITQRKDYASRVLEDGDSVKFLLLAGGG